MGLMVFVPSLRFISTSPSSEVEDIRFWTVERYQMHRKKRKFMRACSCEQFEEQNLRLVLFAAVLIMLGVIAIGARDLIRDRLVNEVLAFQACETGVSEPELLNAVANPGSPRLTPEPEAVMVMGIVFIVLGALRCRFFFRGIKLCGESQMSCPCLAAAAVSVALKDVAFEGESFEKAKAEGREAAWCLVPAALLTLLVCCTEVFVFPRGIDRAGRGSSRLPRRADLQPGEIPTGDELLEAAENARETEVLSQVLPKLPDWLDPIVGNLLLVMPVVVIGSWVAFSVWAYKEGQKQKEADEKRKLRKAIKLGPWRCCAKAGLDLLSTVGNSYVGFRYISTGDFLLIFCKTMLLVNSWEEYLVIEKLKDDHWLCVDIDWCFKELGYFESAAQAFGHQKCRFGKLEDAERFSDSDLQSDKILCFFLRTNGKGEPLPSLREGGESLEASPFDFEGQSLEPEYPRGEGRGLLQAKYLEALQKLAGELRPCIRSPHDFLQESLQLWVRLVSLLSIDSSAENDRRRARASRKNQAWVVSGLPGTRLAWCGKGGMGGKGGKSQARGVKGGAAKTLADSEEPSDTEDRYEDPKGREGFEKVLRCCWELLRPDAQRHFLTEANNFVANILQKNLQRDLQEEPGRSVEERLSEKLTELAAGIREGQRAQCGDHLHGSMLILVNYENSVLMSPGSFKPGKEGADKNVERLARFFYHRCARQFFSTVPVPSVGQCQALHRWKDALRALGGPSQSSSPSDVYNMPTSTTTSGLFMLSGTLLCLVAGFLLEDWADFARLAPCCRRLCSIAWNGESWKVVPVLGPESFDSERQSTQRKHFGPPQPLVDGQNCLSRKVVGLLLLALRTFSARPMYFDREIHSPDSVRLRSLVISFDLPGLRSRLDFGRERQDLTGMHPRREQLETVSTGPHCNAHAHQLLMPRILGFGLCSRFQGIYAELELRFDRLDLQKYKILSMALVSSKSGGIPVSIINTIHSDLFAWKLMLVGQGPLLEENSPTEQGRPMFEPGAYFQLSGGGPHAEIRLPWEPQQLKSGDRLGFMAVEESGNGSGELEIDMLSTGLALVHNGEIAAAKWMPPLRAGGSGKPLLSVNEPIYGEGMAGMQLYVEQYFGARGGDASLRLNAASPSLESFFKMAGPGPNTGA
ncbi:unnamed protein product [Symbiodinium sp. CCMP2592]|nr:unnamed protein product [Symbiodinium sp. CCMP2592]